MSECNETASLVVRPIFIFLIMSEFVIGFLGSVTNTFLMVALWKTRLFHNNLRILLIHMSCAATGFSVSMIAKSIYFFINSVTDPCRLVLTMFGCKLVELTTMLPLLVTMYSLVAIGLERLYATLRYRVYEKSKNIGLSLGLIAIIWTFALVSQVYPLKLISKNQTIPFCVNLLVMTKHATMWTLIWSTGQEIVAVILFIAIYFINKKLYVNLLINRASDQTLTSRFQLAQNIQVSELMLPTAIAHAAFILPINALVVVVFSGLDVDFSHRVELLHTAYLSVLVYAFVHPIICFSRNAALRRAVRTWLSCHQKEFAPARRKILEKRRYTQDFQLTGTASESDKHFDILMKTWQYTGK